MRKVFLFPAVICVLALFAACGASEDPALMARIKSMSEQKGRTLPASGAVNAPMGYAAGQYVTTVVIDGKKRSISRTGIVGQRDGGWVIEMTSLSPSEESVMAICVGGLEKLARGEGSDKLEIIWIKMRDKDGKVSVIDRSNPAMMFMRGTYKDMLSGMNYSATTSYEQGGAVSVPAGTFNGTLKVKSSVTVMGSTYKSVNWMHSGVPISAMVRSEADGTVIELVDFGYDYKAVLD